MKSDLKEIKEFHEKIARYYGDRVSKEIIKLIKRYIKSPILDSGAGSGALINLLSNMGFEDVIGIDIAPKNNVIYGEISNLKFEDESFNTVFCCEVIEHLPQRILNKSCKELTRVLRKGGHLIVTAPYKEKLELSKCPQCGKHMWGHVRSINKRYLKKLFPKLKCIKIIIEPLTFLNYYDNFILKPFLKFIIKKLRYERTIIMVLKK